MPCSMDNLEEYLGYVDRLIHSANKEVESYLLEKYRDSVRRVKGLARKRGKGIGRVVGYASPLDVEVVTQLGARTPVVSACNPALEVVRERLNVYIRISTSRFDRSFVARATLDLKEIYGRVRLRADVLLPGIAPYESVEDPRVGFGDGYIYHVRAFYRYEESRVYTFRAKGSTLEAVLFSLAGETFPLRDYRDTFPLSRDVMVFRPYIKEEEFGFIALAPYEDSVVDLGEVVVPPLLQPMEGDVKTGGNASLRLSSNEYLLLYHAVDEHGVYYVYGALLDPQGEVLSWTREPLLAPTPGLYSGRRPSTVFPCGAVKLGDKIVISAGVDDEITVFYEVDETDLWRLLEALS